MSNAVSVWRRYEANSSKLYKCCASAKASLEGREEEKNRLPALWPGPGGTFDTSEDTAG